MLKYLKNLFFPPKCVGCSEIFSLFSDENNEAFCNKCKGEWEKSKLRKCNKCKLENVDCICLPKALENYIKEGFVRQISVTKFGSCIQVDKLIYALKKQNSKRLFDFAAKELYDRLSYDEKMMCDDYSDIIITNIPRSRKSVAKYGFDQAQMLAKRLSEYGKWNYENLILRKGNSNAQKTQNYKERMENVKDSFELSKSARIEGKRVVLLDDVITTGASAAECVRILKEANAENVIVLTLAKTDDNKKNHKRK